MVTHYRLLAGDTVRFRGSNGTIYSYTIQAINPGLLDKYYFHPNYGIGDVCVAVLNSDVHESIAHYPICGDWVQNIVALESENPPMDQASPYQSWPIPTFADNMFCGVWIGGTDQPAYCGMRLDQSRNVWLSAIASATAGRHMTRTESTYEGQTIEISLMEFVLLVAVDNVFLPGFMSSYGPTYCPSGGIGGDSGSPTFMPLSSSTMGIVALQQSKKGGVPLTENLLNILITATDAAAGVSTGLAVTVAPDPTL